MKKRKLIIIISSIIILLTIVISLYFYGLTPVSKDSHEIEFTVLRGSRKIDIINKLKSSNLIKSKFAGYIYIGLNKKYNLQAGTYILNQNMSLKEILNVMDEGKTKGKDTISFTFVEGKRLPYYVKEIAGITNKDSEEVLEILNNKNYLRELIDKYWFLTSDILNSDIYYGLEGYLYPDTYEFYVDCTPEDIIKTMLDTFGEKLKPYEEDLKKSKYTIHEIITLASIIENEGKTDDFENISSVFHNRLNKGMKLESCATSYYGAKEAMTIMGIASDALITAKNPYNTYSIKDLPVGPISSPSKKAIEAALKPNDTEFYFFLSDNKKNTYFFKTYDEHQKKQKELSAAGLWAR